MKRPTKLKIAFEMGAAFAGSADDTAIEIRFVLNEAIGLVMREYVGEPFAATLHDASGNEIGQIWLK